jgi:hypothetical protein|tara:strand:- start:15515 stop:15640 length:126 start_codon:yes stop_codon:yes gene_type:complete
MNFASHDERAAKLVSDARGRATRITGDQNHAGHWRPVEPHP